MMGKFAEDGAALKGLGAMGETIRQKVVIKNPSLGAVEIPELDAVVTDFPFKYRVTTRRRWTFRFGFSQALRS